ncbi:NADPH-dependent F420 reductase [Microscilla marina]|uniref:NADP oxidoreductase coenzyme f420-dependent superfamily n=1 Tax=Microscilla marina ATCC 23134 TaxID=313606 RepID=A1ZD57_MICM2|nr:NADPH-dependent F420 reductase [Microscilla marina]EAY31596.1 NADP oxidoreductase coenzyme f420-dependent superfamily [Microscilla marina ATCC 23134]
MNIAIIGTGNVGGALATQWSKAAHTIFLGVKEVTDFKGKHLLQNPHTSVHTVADAAQQAEVILVATPPQIAPQLAAQMGNVAGKVIIDATNTINASPEGYPTAFHAFAALTKAEVIKCFNTTGFENMQQPDYGHVVLDMMMAGSSEQAKAITGRLAQEAGFAHCYDFGKADKVVLLEQFALSWINLAIFQGMGRDIGFKLVRRQT